ncbi:MAG TPA: efflux RND transporter periplasmic adaptor subunit, partial [Bacteroidia bacterium]|nr:efflux RND transporter periplasmic adaptor subunit [Bacteroidia bacterium]
MHTSALGRAGGATYEHIDPAQVGNRTRVLVSDLGGRAGMSMKATEFGVELDDSEAGELSERLKQLEALAQNDRANADELSRARADHEIALADLQLAREAAQESQLEARQIEAQIEQRSLRAPFDGVVARVHQETAASVSPQEGPVLTLVNLAELDLVVHIDHRRLDGLQVGAEVKVEALDRPVSGTATIAFISPIVDAPSGTARVRLSLANATG